MEDRIKGLKTDGTWVEARTLIDDVVSTKTILGHYMRVGSLADNNCRLKFAKQSSKDGEEKNP